jgi:flagellar protein FlaG
MSIQSVNGASSPHVARAPGTEVSGRPIDEANNARAGRGDAADAAPALTPSAAENRSGQDLKNVVNDVNEFIKPINNTLQFSIDDETGTTVVKVIDTETDKVIKQIPSEEMLALAKAIGQLKGLLVKQEA